MNTRKYLMTMGILGLGAAGFLLSQTHESVAAKTFSKEEKTAIETIIQDYIDDNPEIVMKALQAAQIKQEKERQASAQEKIKSLEDYFKNSSLPSLGRPNADVTVVEFFDYNCGYCKRALADVQEIAEQDKNVRFVFQEMPILSQSSLDAAKWAMAAHQQGKYFEYHAALMEFRGPKNKSNLEKLAKDAGLDVERLKSDVDSDAVNKAVQESVNIARQIGITGTPAFIINNQLYPGYIGKKAMEKAIKDAREG